jgi:penicillin-binding protein 1A
MTFPRWPRAGSFDAWRMHSGAFRPAVVALCGVACAMVIAAGWYTRVVLTSLPAKAQIHEIASMAQATTLLDAHDQAAFTIYHEQRIEVPLARISPHLIRAIVAVEDQRFYDHEGIDLIRVAGAAINNLREGSRAEGGSTLTQQLARQSFLTPERTYTRKLKELVLAKRIEREFSKDEILELYLNKVYFGAGLYGAEAASLGYFGKPAAGLDVAQAAMLAGLVKSPSASAPTVNLERATARRNLVLKVMRDSGVITGQDYDKAVREKVVLQDSLRRAEAYGQYFKEAVRRELVERFGYERVYEGGLKVYTTMDLEMQKAAEAEVTRSLKEIEERQAARRRKGAPAPTEPLQASLVAMNPETGEVRALVGGRDFRISSFDRATQAKRQAGSAFKPFVYAAAIEAGYSPGSLITGLDAPIETPQGAWTPEDEHLESPFMTMRTALRTSSNRAAVHMLDDVGLSSAVALAKRMGVGDVPSVPSLALGAGEVTLMSMTAAYGAFANQGVRPAPTLIRRVETASGELLYEHMPSSQRVVSESTAFLMTTMLADVINSGTAWPARRVGFTLPAAGKTGTTNEYRDAWFIGFTPHLVSGVWIGYDQPRTIVAGGYAAELAVPLWGRFMVRATNGNEPDWYRAPRGLTTATICRLSGKLANHDCGDVETVDRDGLSNRRSQIYTEYFVSGSEPTEHCDLHGNPLGRGVLSALASVFRGGSAEPAPPPPPVVHVVADVAAPPATVSEAAPVTPPAAPTAAETPQRKRGFWSRVFGRGDRDRK